MHNRKDTPPRVTTSRSDIFLAIAGSGTALFLIGILHGLSMSTTGVPLLMAPFGASAVLVFGSWSSTFAQPRCVIGGHVLSALAGVVMWQFAGGNELVAVSVAVPLSIAIMHMAGVMHPPGGATAFIAAAGGHNVHSLGYWYIISPCLAGSVVLILIALLVNNIPQRKRYPVFW